MNSLLTQFNNAIRSFAKDEEGAQIVEYGLIIAVISIVLIVALAALSKSDGGFTTFINKVTACLKGTTGCT
jgi:pilus assembly protein Flp/PilA